MHDDDQPVGRILSRRDALAAMGAAGAALFFGCKAATDPVSSSGNQSCLVRPALTQGPYFVDEKLQRSDIRSDPSDGSVKPGALLALTFNVTRYGMSACTPMPDVLVDVWHCDHLGVYSDASDPGFNTIGKKFLRGYQVTDAGGVARFTTIYPGWYAGRAVHLHFKMRTSAAASSGFDFTSQLFFDDALTDAVHATPPYSVKGQRTTRNAADGIYNQGGGQLLLDVARTADGYAAAFNIALQL